MIRPKRYLMKLAERELQLGDRTLIMGIINVTPDSFSDGGQTMDPDRAAARAIELEAAGADIIDIGAESTRPGSERISEAEELRRLIPVLKKLKGKLSVPISVDTSKSAVAAKALENGAEIINDASTLTFDMELAKVVADSNAGLILNHMRGTPETWAKLGTMAHPMKSVMEDLEAGVNRARRAGVERSRIILDPGLGFGKRGEQNYELIARLGEMAALGLPVLVGPSRKSFLGQQETLDADRATAAAVVASVLHGAHIVRVHDVSAIRAVLQTADGILRSVEVEEPAEKKPRKAAVAPRDVEFGDKRAPEFTEGKPLRPPRAAAPASGEVKPFEERPRRAYDEERPRRTYDEDRPRRTYDDERPKRSYDNDRPQRSFSGDRPPSRRFDRDERPPRRSFGSDDRPQRSYGSDDRPSRPPYRSDSGGDRPSRPPYRSDSGGDRPSRPPYRSDSGGDRPSRPPYRSGDGPPPKRFSGGDSRPPKRFSGGGDDRPPFKKPYGEKNAGDRPPFKKKFDSGGGGKPPYRKDSGGGFKSKGSPIRSPRPKRDS
ncbi:MAG: dihydropteroate synthase [Bryobacterales bacterium]|nr:dihydropteroate synthase [Bryobacterales bacterium]